MIDRNFLDQFYTTILTRIPNSTVCNFNKNKITEIDSSNAFLIAVNPTFGSFYGQCSDSEIAAKLIFQGDTILAIIFQNDHKFARQLELVFDILQLKNEIKLDEGCFWFDAV